MTRRCQASGTYTAAVDTTSCVSRWVQVLSARGINSSTLAATMLDLHSIARAEASFFGSQDVASVINLLQDAAGTALEVGIISLQTTADIVATSSELVGSTGGASFAAGEALRSNSSSSATLGRSLEQVSAVLAASLPSNSSAVVITDASVAMAERAKTRGRHHLS